MVVQIQQRYDLLRSQSPFSARGPCQSAFAMIRSTLAIGLVLAIFVAAGCRPAAPRQPAAQSPKSKEEPAAPALAQSELPGAKFVGSKTCQDCHADFYKLWRASWHGLAMQPYSPEFAKARLTPQQADIAIGKRRYRAEVAEGCMHEIGPEGEHKYSIAHVMGGKNVYYLLTPLDRGRLQVLPLAYDVHQKKWYDMAASGVRHFPDRRDEALDWTDRMFAFNTTCFNCHVTELATNYDLAGDAYHTTWSEPGISCESCHGSAKEHIRVMEEAEARGGGQSHFSGLLPEKSGQSPGPLERSGQSPGRKLKDIKIVRSKDLTARQNNDLCATCHAKMIPLSLAFIPGDKFFDHFDLITLDHPDFYPDGRDLGENYTYTSWLMSGCARSGKLDCNHCHTPSGRPRFEREQSKQMCMPCHAQQCNQPAGHGHHAVGSKGNECIACHMPMTRFAAMGRSDHSMRPPMPAATTAFKSPNACNLCHADRDAAWADRYCRQWYKRDYQAESLRRGELLDQARKQQWKRLPEMLAEIQKADGDEVYKTSWVRLLQGCDDQRKWPVLMGALHDRSALVRSSAVSGLGGNLTPEVLKALVAASGDESRLVRIRVAMALAALRPDALPDPRERAQIERATREFMTAMQARPDDWASHSNLGNYYLESRDFSAAAACFETATKLEPRQIGPLVNAAMAYSNMEQNDRAEQCLRRALKQEPANAAANFNLGLLLGEQGQMEEAEQALRTALKTDPQMAAAAYNLGVLLGKKNIDEAVAFCQKAHDLRPTDPKYAHTLAFYQRQKGNVDASIKLLRQVIQQTPLYLDSYLLLAEIYEGRHDLPAAAEVYRSALKQEQLPPSTRSELQAKLHAIEAK
jgi:tetratricopeptide (TPR) repeat protein